MRHAPAEAGDRKSLDANRMLNQTANDRKVTADDICSMSYVELEAELANLVDMSQDNLPVVRGQKITGKAMINALKTSSLGRDHLTAQLQYVIVNYYHDPGVTDDLDQKFNSLINLKLSLEPEEAKLREDIEKTAPHVNKVHRERDLALYLWLSEECHRNPNGDLLDCTRDLALRGIPVYGRVPRVPNIFPELPYPKNDEEGLEVRDRQKIERRKPPSWASSEHNLQMRKTFLERIQGVDVVRIRFEDCRYHITYNFPTVSANKLRQIADFRSINARCPYKDKLQLVSHSSIVRVIQSIHSGKMIRTPFGSGTRKDISFDIKSVLDKKNLLGIEGLVGEEETETPIRGSMAPGDQLAMAAIDLQGYYFQNAVDVPEHNVQGIYCEEKKCYEYYQCPDSQFGSIHSIYGAVRISETIVSIIRGVLKIVAIMYIDDIVLFGKRSNIEQLLTSVQTLLVLLGFRISYKKCITSNGSETHSLKVLGLVYSQEENQTKVSVDADRMLKTGSRIDSLCKLIEENKKFGTKDVEKVVGNIVWATFFRFQTMFSIRALYKWTIDKFFHSNIKRKAEKRALVSLCKTIKQELENVKPLTIAPVKNIWSLKCFRKA